MNARSGPLSDHKIDPVILHSGIKDLFDGGEQAMNFIEKKDLADFDGGENGSQVTLALQQRARAGFDSDAQLAGDNLRERSFPEAGRTVEQDMIERIAAAARRLDGDQDVFLNATLTDEIDHALGAHTCVEPRVLVEGATGNDAFGRV